MRTLLFVSITFLPLALAAQVDLRLPDGWIEDPAPSDLPAGITEMKSASSEDDAVEITIIATDPANSVAEADRFIASLIAGMGNRGFIQESVTDTEIHGFPVKHIVGEFRSSEYEGAYLADTKVFFSDEATITVSVSVDDAMGGRDLISPVVDWVSIPGSPAVLPAETSGRSSVMENLGYYGFYAALLALVVIVVRRRSQRAKASKSEP